jgi:hypothetical protein
MRLGPKPVSEGFDEHCCIVMARSFGSQLVGASLILDIALDDAAMSAADDARWGAVAVSRSAGFRSNRRCRVRALAAAMCLRGWWAHQGSNLGPAD